MQVQNRPIHLGVNVDHVATVRQARRSQDPEVVLAALEAEMAGARGITAHLREDRRHIQDRDIRLLKEVLKTRLNLEMAVTEEMVSIAEKIQPAACCLVPEKREELTTEGGLDVAGQFDRVRNAVSRLVGAGIEVSLFIDPDARQIEAAQRAGAPFVELHTGTYAEDFANGDEGPALSALSRAASAAEALGLKVNAGHGLNYQNVGRIARIPEIHELNIGHAIIARALFTGMDRAVREMRNLMENQRALGEESP